VPIPVIKLGRIFTGVSKRPAGDGSLNGSMLTMDHTGSVRAQGTLFHVPSPFRQKGKIVILGLDPQKRIPPCLITASGERIALVPALRPSPKGPGPAKGPLPTGS
jgi:hypothetical protein